MPTASFGALDVKGNFFNDAGNPKYWGAVADGVADDRAFFVLADAALGRMTLSPGFYLIGENLTIASHVTPEEGAIIKPAAGKTVHFAGGFTGTLRQYFDLSLGGMVTFGANPTASVYPQWWGAVGDGVTNDSVAFQAAINAASAVGGGEVFVPPTTTSYLVTDLILYGNITLRGVGWKSKLQRASGGGNFMMSVNPGTGGTSNPNDNAFGVQILDLWIRGLSLVVGLNEGNHLINLNAVSDFRVEGCKISAFESDGVYIGSSNSPATERHNQRGYIARCFFDGEDARNRNGISVIDCDSLTIESCIFMNIGAATMPACIDVEPDSDFNVNRNLVINHCYFKDCANISAVALLLRPQSSVTTPQEHFVVENCWMQNMLRGFTAQGMTGLGGATGTTTPYHMTFQSNHLRDCDVPFILHGVAGCVFDGNKFIECSSRAEMGFEELAPCFDIIFENNILYRCGLTSTDALWIRSVDLLWLIGNAFIDCGVSGGGSGRAIFFQGTNTGTNIRFSKNYFATPAARTTAWIGKDAAYTLTAITNIDEGDNVYTTTLSNSFPQSVAPTLLNSWVNFGAPYQVAGFFKRGGVVHLQGLIKSGTTTADTPLFSLPDGFRPGSAILRNISSNNLIAFIQIDSDGTVRISSGASSVWLSLEGVSFRPA